MIDLEAGFLDALHAEPGDDSTWLALSDWLDETGQDDRAELVRLWCQLRQMPERRDRCLAEQRICDLLAGGTRPVVPTLTNSIGMTLALVPAGTFWMGSPAMEVRRNHDEGPRHQVVITRAYYLGIYPVTQEQFRQVMGYNPSWFCHNGGGDGRLQQSNTHDFPVEYITWYQAVEFCERLSRLDAEVRAGRVYHLPSEAMWEYACRAAGTSTMPFHFGRTAHASLANFDGNYPYGDVHRSRFRQRPVAVGSFVPNALGLYDMHGNVWEWCADWYDPDYYRRSPAVDPPGPESGEDRVLRGGSWIDCGHNCRSAFRDLTWAGARMKSASGMRVAMTWQG